MIKISSLKGSFTALITPFREGRVDEEGLKRNIEFQLVNDTSGLVPCGTTGESPTISLEEWEMVVKTTVESAQGKIPVIAGTGTNDTKKTIKLTKRAKELGCDSCLVVCPYYNKPTQEGLYRHFAEIAQSVDLPIIIYNIPGRTGVNILPKTVERLVKGFNNIIGIKEASGNLDQVSEIVVRCEGRISVLSGDDALTLPILSVGGQGVISVISNILPKAMADLVKSYLTGNVKKARELHRKLFPLMKVLFIETNPIPIKTAMNLLKMPSGDLRPPLYPPSEENFNLIKKELKNYGLLR
ncbi:MAG: 4-hydroxy-tetrahydrodipicolinate synthase [candidate division WOR-3 bacterium]